MQSVVDHDFLFCGIIAVIRKKPVKHTVIVVTHRFQVGIDHQYMRHFLLACRVAEDQIDPENNRKRDHNDVPFIVLPYIGNPVLWLHIL